MPKKRVYLVGGAVRDSLLNLSVHEKDWLVTGTTVKQMLDDGYKLVGKDFPVFLHPKTREEYALARTERKISAGYHGFEMNSSVDITVEEDLLRRDLTINAIAIDKKDNLIDPFNGVKDLQNKLLRHISPAFSEDPVRVLRVARFAARFAHLGFKVAEETLALMRKMVSNGEVNALVAERVWQETHKALQTKNPQVFFETLIECNALKVLFIEIEQLFGVPQPAKWHPEIDCGIHTMMVLQQAALLTNNTESRFAALCHDLGKGTTPIAILPSHRGHEMRGLDEIKNLCTRLRVPKKYQQLALKTAEFHTHCHKITELKTSTILKTIEKFNATREPDRFNHFLSACMADARGRTGHEKDDYPQADKFKQVVKALSQIDSGLIAKQCESSQDIAEAIRQARLKVIKQVQATW